jgi:hypothetical protein
MDGWTKGLTGWKKLHFTTTTTSFTYSNVFTLRIPLKEEIGSDRRPPKQGEDRVILWIIVLSREKFLPRPFTYVV